jgi:glycosyltransferase involved in cell wall biosynthesis
LRVTGESAGGRRQIRVAALTSGPEVPSSRFRVRQNIEALARQGIEVREFSPRVSKYDSPRIRLGPALKALQVARRVPGLVASRRADLTWIERELLAGRASVERWTGRPRIFDVDDAIWHTSVDGREFALQIAEQCDGVVVCNDYLADHFKSLEVPVWVVPTAVDPERWRPRAKEAREALIVGWTGLASNLPSLYAIEPALSAFLDSQPAAVLHVIAESPPRFRRLDESRVRWVRWSPESEAMAVAELDIGLMPLPDDEWSCGKCAFKMLQYMSAGIPVVASPVGMNAEILGQAEVGCGAAEQDDWTRALEDLASDQSLRERLGEAGRRLVGERYSVPVVSARLASIFREVVGA